MLALRRVGFAGWLTLVAFAAGVAAIVAAATMQCDDAGLSYVLRESMYFGAPALCLVAFVWSVVRRRRGLIALAAVGIVVSGAGYMIAWITSVLCVVS